MLVSLHLNSICYAMAWIGMVLGTMHISYFARPAMWSSRRNISTVYTEDEEIIQRHYTR